jgi:amino-acid N-acetyltransferase
MPKLYLEEYRKNLAGKSVLVVCREGILRDHFDAIMADIKFLNRQGIRTTLFHDLPNRFANQQHFRALQHKLPETRIVRVDAGKGLYRAALESDLFFDKLIFLERKFLMDHRGRKLNTLTTGKARLAAKDFGDRISNTGLRGVFNTICEAIEAGRCERVHILPAGRHKIKHELFAIEGSGTLIANDFHEAFTGIRGGDDVRIVYDILKRYRRSGYLKPRTKDYIAQKRKRFRVARIDDIIVGCLEAIGIDHRTVELGALAIATRYRNQQIGSFLVRSFLDYAADGGYACVISLTNNPRLARLYKEMAFRKAVSSDYPARQRMSPGVQMYVRCAGGTNGSSRG